MAMAGIFGVGCFAFEWVAPAGERNAEVWRNDVTAGLATLANVSNIMSLGSSKFLMHTLPAEMPDQQDDFHPAPVRAAFKFDIKIPRRQQRDIPEGMTTAENFRVVVDHEYWGPVAFVLPLDACNLETASLNVKIVREHLAEYFGNNGTVRFRSVGPSPFHAELQLQPTEEKLNSPVSLKITKRRGYDLYDFVYSADHFDSLQAAFDELRKEIAEELSLYYQLIRDGNARMFAASEVGFMTNELIELHTKSGLKARWTRLFGSAGHARDLALAVMQAEFAIASDKEQAEGSIASLRRDHPGYFETLIAEELGRDASAFISNGRNVVSQLESGRTKELEVTMIAGASLTGAVAGGVISAIVSGILV